MKKIISAFFCGFIIWLLIYNLNKPAEQTFTTYTVQENDTLWGIAEKHYNNTDPRKAIYYIEKYNSLDTYIEKGDKIKLPAILK